MTRVHQWHLTWPELGTAGQLSRLQASSAHCSCSSAQPSLSASWPQLCPGPAQPGPHTHSPQGAVELRNSAAAWHSSTWQPGVTVVVVAVVVVDVVVGVVVAVAVVVVGVVVVI